MDECGLQLVNTLCDELISKMSDEKRYFSCSYRELHAYNDGIKACISVVESVRKDCIEFGS